MKIGIAVRKDETDYFVHQSYCEFLKQNDLTFDFISLTTPLDSFDGFLIPGGNDIHSKYYRQFPYACKKIDEEMDLLDQKIILEAVRTKNLCWEFAEVFKASMFFGRIVKTRYFTSSTGKSLD